MKRILILGVVLTIFVASASAQDRGDRSRRNSIERGFQSGQLSRGEKFRLRKDRVEYRAEKRKAMKDGRLSHFERRKLATMKRHDRKKMFRMKHNGRRRII